MPIVPWRDVFNPNVATGNPLLPIADAGRRAICQYRQAYPLAFQNPVVGLSSASRPLQRFNEAVWDRICPEPEYSIPTASPPFYGGQCDTFYRLLGFVYLTNGSRASDFEDFLRGPLAEAGIRRVQLSDTNSVWQIFWTDANNNSGVNSVFSGAPGQVRSYEFELRRNDGQPDVCGDAPIPPVIINNPPPTSLDVTVNLGNQIVNTTLTPTNLVINEDNSFEFSPEFELGDIRIRPTIEGLDVDLQPTLALSPDVDVDLNVGGVGGALGNVLDILPSALELLTRILDLIEGGGGGECDLRPLADYIRCLIEKPNATINESTFVVNSGSGIYPISSGCVGVIVTRTGDLAAGTKVQSGTGNNPNVEYWGWASFGFSGNFTERTPLNYQNTFLKPPANANQVLINPTFGNRFTGIELIEDNSCTFDSNEA